MAYKKYIYTYIHLYPREGPVDNPGISMDFQSCSPPILALYPSQLLGEQDH